MTDTPTTPRRKLSPTKRLKIFEVHGGICCICTRRIRAGEKWIVEHLRALGLGGPDTEDNMRPAHEACAAVKTHDEDMPRITKAKRIKRKHLGIHQSGGRPMAGTKRSGWKKPFNGPAEKRT